MFRLRCGDLASEDSVGGEKMAVEFDASFEALTGYGPFRWQRRLFAEIECYNGCDIPTGLGKTAIIPIWLIALAAQGERAAAARDMSLVTLPRPLPQCSTRLQTSFLVR